MSSKKIKKKDFFSKMRKQIVHIFKDIMYVYKNFLHWNISKILISIWSMCLAFIAIAPIIVLIIIIGFIDPIKWNELLGFIVSGNDVSYTIIGELALHPYWVFLMAFVLFIGIILFIITSSYSLLLQANLALHYLKGKPLKFKKNLYFSRSHIVVFMSIVSWYIMYILAPVIIWVGIIFFMYLFFNIGFIGFELLSLLIAGATVILAITLAYLVYRIVFGYVFLAVDAKKKKLHSARSYVKKSIKITSGKSFWVFLFLSMLYALCLLPFTSIDSHFEIESGYLKDTMLYNSGLVANISPEQMPYYEYITKEYSSLSGDEIVKKMNAYYVLRVVLFFFMYFVFEGLFVFILVSFYTRVLHKK